MQAIETKYFGFTDNKDNRIKATCQAGSVTIDWNDDLEPEENHRMAATALYKKYDWKWEGRMFGGQLPSGNYCFVRGA